ncbi:hypothetical protein [Bacillus massilinigeriensis]|uniref:hypothetical protein n=1 Tax=Bacillus mediterraneensis TaxID=1805474 RepID=UPI0008F8A279|nr:hypothetical protein [Bacillus mediterraneensis]
MNSEEKDKLITELNLILSELRATLKTLNKKAQRYESAERMSSAISTKPLRIHIDVLNISQPVVQEWIYRLESVEIENLNGTMHIGNNLQKNASCKKSPSFEDKDVGSQIKIKVNGTLLPYTFI